MIKQRNRVTQEVFDTQNKKLIYCEELDQLGYQGNEDEKAKQRISEISSQLNMLSSQLQEKVVEKEIIELNLSQLLNSKIYDCSLI